MPGCQLGLIEDAETPVFLCTANDLVNGDKKVPQQTGELGEVAEPYVLDISPDVLSIGRRCVQQCYAFSWYRCSLKPTLTKPDGSVTHLISRGCCPYLDDYEPEGFHAAAPALDNPDPAYASQRTDVACERNRTQRLPYGSQRADVASESGDGGCTTFGKEK